jgi:hypothetical protein
MVFIHPWVQGNESAYRHVTLHDRISNVTRPITRGLFTDKNQNYFRSTEARMSDTRNYDFGYIEYQIPIQITF